MTIYDIHLGFLTIRITESPLTNSLLMNLSLTTGFALLPLHFLGISIQVSHAFSRIMFICLSNALTLASIFLLFLREIKTCAFDLTVLVSSDNGPTSKVSLFSRLSSYIIKYQYNCSLFLHLNKSIDGKTTRID